MINIEKYEGHTPIWYLNGNCETGTWWVQSDFTTHDDFVVAEVRSQNDVDAQLIADAPLLLAELKWLRNIVFKFDDAIYHGNVDINQLPDIWHNLLRQLTKEEEE
jgi:hypothetical protein